jgi:hypothetical protein
MHEHSRRQGRSLRLSGALVSLLLLTSLPLFAHHGWGGYRSEDFQITGIVESPVTVSGPHASLKIRVEGQVWNVVLAPPARTERAGLKAGMIPIGAEVTAYGHRHRDQKTLEIKTERLRWNDRLFNVYPDRT